jgi:hypothetical protein
VIKDVQIIALPKKERLSKGKCLTITPRKELNSAAKVVAHP